jgi:hypothetical protein
MLAKVQGKQPLRTVGELKEFLADIPNETLLASYSQDGDQSIFPVVAELAEPEEAFGDKDNWWEFSYLVLSGYDRYADDPNLSDSWRGC